ncbi:MAG: hypothetical protein J7L94_14285 [Caldisericaceae bacterium]|nr:hypothetical protein [Caldisericaceae bacterium]
MISQKPFFRIPQTKWRILKIYAHGTLWLNESTKIVAVKEVQQIKFQKKLEMGLDYLPSAYVDVIYIEKGFSKLISEKALIKIMNSDAMILIPNEQKDRYQNLFLKIGYQINHNLTPLHGFSVFRKNNIPCCGS